MRKFYLLLLFVIVSFIGRAQVNVTATAGTTSGSYANLKLAFDAINAGTHQGAIIIDIMSNGTDPAASAVLNSGNATPAAFTSVLIRPQSDGVNISATVASGRGVIELNGADNVTIDGDNPNTGGTNRNLEILNQATNTTTFTSVIRLATGTGVASTDNVTVQNCIITGSATGRNAAGTTSTTGSENTTFGIYCGGNGGTTATTAPTALSSVTTNTATTGTTINSFTATNNTVNACARGIVFNGAVVSVATGTTTITNNLIGDQSTVSGTPPYTTPATTVYTKGIFIAGVTSLTITGNSIKNILSYVNTPMHAIELNSAIGNTGATVNINNNTINGLVNNSTATSSIIVGIIVSASATGTTMNINSNTINTVQTSGGSSVSMRPVGITYSGTSAVTMDKNKISTIYNRSTGTAGCYGINITSGSNCIIKNNFIWDLNQDMSGGVAFSTTFGVLGIRLGGGTGHKIYHNTVSLYGALLGTPNSALLTAPLCITGTGITGVDVRNNIFSNVITGGTTSIAHVSMMLPSGGTSGMNLTINNNAYYTGTTAGVHGICHGGTTYTATVSVAGTGLYTVANFNAGATTPVTNLRNYTNALNTVSGNDNASLAFNTAAPFVSATDLHMNFGVTPTQLESGGAAAVGVTDDIDGQTRPGPAGSINGGAAAPDMGADEFDAVPLDISAPAISYTPLSFTCNTADRILSNVTITDVSSVPTSGGFVPRIYYRKNAGTWFSQAGSLSSGNGNNGTWTFVIVAADMGGLAGGDVVQYYIIAQDQAATPNIGSNPSGVTATNVNTVSAHPASPNSFNISNSLGGTYTVGAAGTYTTLTAAIAAYNTSCLTGPVVFSLIDASYTEAAAMTITANPDASATNTLTIKPTLSNTAIAVTGGSTSAIITLSGADYVTIDGSVSNTVNTVCPASSAARDLTITNTNSGTSSAVIWLASNATDGATNNTIKNINLTGNSNTTTLFGAGSGSSTIGTSSLGNGNHNNSIINNNISKTQFGIYSQGASAANKNTGTVINQNLVNTASPNNVQLGGILTGFENNLTISGNNIGNLTTTGDIFGISAGMGNSFVTTTLVGNEVGNVTISNNTLNSISSTSTTGFTALGIAVGSLPSGAVALVSNNMISGVSSLATPSDYTGGIVVGGGSGTYNIFYNTVSMTGTRGAATAPSYAFAVAGTTPLLNIKNNIFHNTQTSTGAGQSLAIGLAYSSTAGNYLNLLSDYNDLYVSGTSSILTKTGSLTQGSGTNFSTLAAWQAETGRDANSKNVLPVFISATDLHLDPNSNPTLNDAATTVSVTNDIDCNTRSATPDIGADEFAPPPCTAAGGTTVATPTGPFCAPGSTVLTLTGAGIGTGTSYQWQTSPDGVSWADSTGQTSATMSVTGLMATRWYRCMLTCTATSTLSPSVPVQVVVNAAPTALVTPAGPLYLCTPSTQLLSVATNAVTPSYQWKLAGTNIGGATSSTYTVTGTGTYTVTVTDAATTCATTSAAVNVFIDPPPPAPVISPSSTTMCENGDPVAINITNAVSPIQMAFGTQANQNTGTVSPTDYPAPYTLYYGGQRMQMLIRASELAAAGYAAGTTFTDIQFPVVSRGANWGVTTTALLNFQVSIGHTSLTTLSTFQTGLTQVSAPASFTPVVGYTNTHTFGTPFTWDGSSNIIVETTFSNNVFGTLADLVTQYYTSTAFQSCVVFRADNQTAAAMASAATPTYTYSARPDFKLNGSRSSNFTWSPTAGLYTDAAGTIPYTGNAAVTVYARPAGTTTYTATSCTASGTATVNVTSVTALAGAIGGPQRCNTATVIAGGSYYHFGACNLIAKVTPAGSPAVSGSVDACVKIDASVQTDPYNVPYVTRHYDITPATGAATAQAQLTLYFLQSEFDDFNTYVTTNALAFPLLPTGGVDNGNVKITQFHGTGTVPGNYTGAPELIVPASVVWNATKGWWEVSFPVMGFSGFYLHSGSKSLLPVPFNALRLSAALTGNTNTVYWTTETEENNKKFIIERSADGRTFTAIGELNSRAPGGNSNTPISYSFVDERPINGKQYYRLRLISTAGGEQLTQIVSLRRGAPGIEFASVRPNPTPGIAYLNVNGTNNEVMIVVRNMEGREILRTVKQPNMEFTINITSQPSGVYMLEATDSKTGLKALFKLVKQ